MHISRISRENEKWFCETFLARNAAARNCGKNRPFLANFEPNLTKIWDFFQGKLLSYELKLLYQMILLDFFEVVLRFIAYFDLTKKLSEKIDQI